MENIAQIFDSSVFKIVLSSAVIAALITSVFNYVAVRNTNKRLVGIESMRIESELTAFRYTKVFDAIEEISNLPEIDYTYLRREGDRFVQDKALFGRLVSEATDRWATVTKVFERVKPLIDEAFLSDVDSAIAEVECQNTLMTKALYKNQPLPVGIDVVTLMQSRQIAEGSIIEAMNDQVRSLTKALP